MNDKEKLIDQAPIANSVSEKIPYSFQDLFLVKPLDPIKVKKEFSKPVPTDNKPKKDKNGIEAVDYDKVETEVKEVDSDFRKGVILKVPYSYKDTEQFRRMPINIGDIVVYKNKYAEWFDILKDTQLVRTFDVIATETVNK